MGEYELKEMLLFDGVQRFKEMLRLQKNLSEV